MVWHHSFLGHWKHADTWSVRFRLNYSHRYPAMNFQLLSLFWDNLSIDCLKKRESSWIYSYQMCFVSRFHQQKQKYFLGGGSIKLRKCFTTLLAITRLLDFEVTTLPYPTRSWKTTTRWGLVVSQCIIGLIVFILQPFITSCYVAVQISRWNTIIILSHYQ